MERIISAILFMAIYTLSFCASPVVYMGCIPECGSEISSWEFSLKFDITAALAEAGEGEFGIGYTAATGQMASLYKIENEDKILLGTSMTTKYVGNSSDFITNNDIISFKFDNSIPIVENQEYQIEITNTFGLFKSGKAVWVTGTNVKFIDNPIVLNYRGAKSGNSTILYQESSINNGDSLYEISQFSVKFDKPILILKQEGVSISENSNVISYGTIKIDETDNSKAIISFPLSVNLLYGHLYDIILDEGAIASLNESSVLNSEIKWNVEGATLVKLPILSSNPSKESNGIFDSISITYDIPNGYTLTLPGNFIHKCSGLFYRETVSEDNLIKSYFGKISEDGNGQVFDLSDNVWEPSTKYIFVKPADDITVWKEGVSYPEYGNDEYVVEWTTPSAEELGLVPITEANFENPKLGKHDESSIKFVDGGFYASIDMLEIQKLPYMYESKSYLPYVRDNAKASIYDITDGQRTFVKDIIISDQRRESNYDYYFVAQLWVQMTFYQGHEYEIVIPDNAFLIHDTKLKNFVNSTGFSYKLKGTTPSSVNLVSQSIENDSEVSELTSMLWIFDGDFSIKEDASAQYSRRFIDSSIPTTGNYPLSAIHSNGQTYVMATFISPYTGKPQTYSSEMECSITLPAGIIFYPADETITNLEIVTKFKGVRAKSTDVEFINTTVTLTDNETNEAHSFIVKSVKGYPAEIQLLPGENWNVEDVAHDGKSLSSVNGVYASEPLTGDSKIVATLAYNKEMQFDQTTGVYSVENSDIKVYTENGQIVVAGLTQPTNIAVYSVGGILVKQMTTEAVYDMVRISAEPNEIYVVVINGQAAKVRL